MSATCSNLRWLACLQNPKLHWQVSCGEGIRLKYNTSAVSIVKEQDYSVENSKAEYKRIKYLRVMEKAGMNYVSKRGRQ
jgi:hypothetical protein